MQTSPFVDLPLEMLLEIFQHLPFEEVFGDIPLVCRNFRQVIKHNRVHLTHMEKTQTESQQMQESVFVGV